MGPTTRICSLALALTLAAATAAEAAPGLSRVDFLRSGASTFVVARAAADAGDSRRAALLYASLAAADASDRMAAQRAIEQAILGGDMPLALRLARRQPAAALGLEARLLVIGDALRSGSIKRNMGVDIPPDLSFMTPFVEAWRLAERRRWPEALQLLDKVGARDTLGEFVPEHKALILLAAGRALEAKALFEPALATARGRSNRLRIVLASGLAASGEREAGLQLLAGREPVLRKAAETLAAERRPRPLVRTAAEGFAELLTSLAVSLEEDDGRRLPLALSQVARHANPGIEQATLLTGLLMERAGRADDAVSLLRAFRAASPFLTEARDSEVRILLDDDRQEEALARARAFVSEDGRAAANWMRLGEALDSMKRHEEAALAYGSAASIVQAGGAGPEPWSIHLLRGAALEQGGQWPQARSALELARRLAPDNPEVLNYLGYASLERGEQLEEAEALIAEASRRAPDDASITDSLGWAQFKRGKVAEAISTLQRAAATDPAQAEIHEHLGDALYTAGRKYEARFAWNAALVTAEDEVRTRVQGKLAAGLAPATAAP